MSQLLKLNAPGSSRVFLEPLKLERKELIFFALNDNDSHKSGGTHWSLLVFSRDEDTFYNFDSYNDFNIISAKTLYHVLKIGLSCPSATLKNQDCTQQTNLYDCGIHVLANVENTCEQFIRNATVRHVPRLPPSVISNKRKEILNLIEHLSVNV